MNRRDQELMFEQMGNDLAVRRGGEVAQVADRLQAKALTATGICGLAVQSMRFSDELEGRAHEMAGNGPISYVNQRTLALAALLLEENMADFAHGR